MQRGRKKGFVDSRPCVIGTAKASNIQNQRHGECPETEEMVQSKKIV